MKVVSASHRNKTIIVKSQTTTTGFSQKEVHTYLPNSKITKFAESLETGQKAALVSTLISFIPGLGDASAVATYLLNGRTANHISQLRSLRNKSKAAQYSTYKSSYGTTAFVGEWDKKTIKGKSAKNSTTKYVVNSIDYAN